MVARRNNLISHGIVNIEQYEQLQRMAFASRNSSKARAWGNVLGNPSNRKPRALGWAPGCWLSRKWRSYQKPDRPLESMDSTSLPSVFPFNFVSKHISGGKMNKPECFHHQFSQCPFPRTGRACNNNIYHHSIYYVKVFVLSSQIVVIQTVSYNKIVGDLDARIIYGNIRLIGVRFQQKGANFYLFGISFFRSSKQVGDGSSAITISSSTMTVLSLISLHKPSTWRTVPVLSVPLYEASLTKVTSQLSVIFFIRSAVNMNDPLSILRNTGFLRCSDPGSVVRLCGR